MGYLGQFIGEKKKVVLSDGKELVLRPLTVRHIKYVLDVRKGEDVNPEAIQSLVKAVLKESYPDSTAEEIDEFPFHYVSEILPVIFEMHELPEGADDVALKDMMNRVRKSQVTQS